MKKTFFRGFLVVLLLALSGSLVYQYMELNHMKVDYQNQKDLISINQNNFDAKLVEKFSELELKSEISSELSQEKELEMESFIEVLQQEITNNNGMLNFTTTQPIDSSYSTEEMQSSLNYISEYLNSFKKLTELTGANMTNTQKNEVGNLDWQTQNLGFYNHQLNIMIGINEMKLLIKRMDFEVAIGNYKLDIIDKTEVVKKRDAYLEAKNEYEKFINDAFYAD